MEFEAGLYEVPLPELDAELLAQRQVAHRPFPLERDAGRQVALLRILHIHHPVLREDLRIEVQYFGVAVPGEDRGGGHPVRKQRVETSRPQFVSDVPEEVHALAGLLALVLGEREIRVLAAR